MTNLPAPLVEALQDKKLASKFTHGRHDKALKIAAERQFAEQAMLKNPKLAQCTGASIQTALLDVAYSGLSLAPSLGHAYLIPYKDQCQFQPGYRGLLHLAYKAGTVKSIQVNLVHEHDPEFQVWSDEHGRHLKHIENQRGNPGEVTHAYVLAFLNAGGPAIIEVMNKAQLAAVRRAAESRPGGGAVWKFWPEEMMKKAVIRRASKFWPKDDGGAMQHMIETADRHSFINFDDVPVDADPPEQELVLTVDQQTALNDVLVDAGVQPEIAPEWLRRYALALGYNSIEAVPARLYDRAYEELGKRAREAVGG